MLDQSDKEVVPLIFIFTAKKDILWLFIIVEELKSRFRGLPVSWTLHKTFWQSWKVS